MIYYYIIILILLIGSARKRSSTTYNLGGDINAYGWLKDGRLSSAIWGAIPLFLILSLKSTDVGIDMVSYVNRFENAEEMMNLFSTASEMGFNYYNLFLNKIGLTWQLYLVVCTLILMIGWISFAHKYSVDTYYSYFLYMTIGLFTMNFSGLRQSLAIAICLIALVLFQSNYQTRRNRSWGLFVLLVLLSATFHNSSIIFIIVPFLFRYRITKKQCFILLLLATAALVYKDFITGFIPNLKGTRYSDFTFDEAYAINPLVILFTIFVPLVSLIFIPTEDDNKFSSKYSLMFFFASINIFFTILSINNNQLGRVAYYFQPCYMILLPATANSILQFDNRKLVRLALSIICIIYFMMGSIGGTLRIDHYTFFWQ